MNIPTANFTTQMMSDTELLQQPTFIESGEKKSKLLGDEEIHSFIKNQQQENTVKKTRYDLNVFQIFLNECAGVPNGAAPQIIRSSG